MPPVATFGVNPVVPAENDDTPDDPPPDAAIEIVPAPLVIVMFDPAVNVARLNPDPLPIKS